MTRKLILFISILIYGCNADINNKDKRNEDWVYWVDAKTGEASWIPLGDQNNVKDGHYTTFYNKGTIYEKGKLKNGKNIDTIYWYDQNEKLIHYSIAESNKFIQYYVNNGSYISYFQDGKIFEKATIKNHKIKDDWTRYYKNGNLEWASNLKKGTGLKRWYYDNGQMSCSTDYIKDKKDGQNKQWFENGKPKEISNWTNGKQNGLSRFYYENGTLEEQTNWVNGKSEGKSESWYANGLRKNTKFYKAGLYDGNLKQWYPNGKIQAEVNFSLEQKDGKATVYYENGNLHAEGFYKHDEKDGVWKYYDENGKITKTETYIEGQVV